MLFLQLFKQVDYLRLNRNVQCRNRLITDNNFWLKYNSASNTNTLALATRELMRVAVLELKVKANFLHNLFNASVALCLCLIRARDINWLANDIHDRHTRVQRAVRILEDKFHLLTRTLEVFSLKRGEVFPIKLNRTRGWLGEAQHALAGCRLSAARLANNSQSLFAPKVKRNILNRMN